MADRKNKQPIADAPDDELLNDPEYRALVNDIGHLMLGIQDLPSTRLVSQS